MQGAVRLYIVVGLLVHFVTHTLPLGSPRQLLTPAPPDAPRGSQSQSLHAGAWKKLPTNLRAWALRETILVRHDFQLRGGGAEAMDWEQDAVGTKAQPQAERMSDSGWSASEDDGGQHIVVPTEGTLPEALQAVLGEDDDQNCPRKPLAASSLSITITEGKHNLTEAGELALCRRLQLAASPGVTIAAYAQPRQDNSMVPAVGGGRFRFMAGSTGSTMSGISMIASNIQCAIIVSAAVLFDSCELRTSNGEEDVSVLFIRDAGHATITSSVLGGVTLADQASQAVVVDGTGAEAVVVNTLLHNCYGSTVIVCNNGTARLSSCEMRDSFAAFAVSDYDTVSTASNDVPARVEAFNCTVQCVAGMWRDDVKASHFRELNTSYEAYAFRELAAHDIDGRRNRTVQPKLSWDLERNTWKHTGMTKHRRQHLQGYYEKYRTNGTVDPLKVYREVQRDLGKRSWESSDESTDVERDGSSTERAQLAPWNQRAAPRMGAKKLQQMGNSTRPPHTRIAHRACGHVKEASPLALAAIPRVFLSHFPLSVTNNHRPSTALTRHSSCDVRGHLRETPLGGHSASALQQRGIQSCAQVRCKI